MEAQANDLPCLFSANVTEEIALSDRAKFIELDAPLSIWANEIIEGFNLKERRNNTELLTEKHYNIHFEALRLQERYLELYGGENEDWYFDTSLYK